MFPYSYWAIMKNKIQVAFRLDDPSATSDHGLEKAIVHIAKQNNVQFTFATIPFKNNDNPDPIYFRQKLNHISDAYNIEVALHGYKHEDISNLPKPSEFKEQDVKIQFEKIKNGKNFLERAFNAKIVGFVPPWNSFDENTIKIIKDLGMKYISAGWDPQYNPNYHIKLLPRTCHLNDIENAVTIARRMKKNCAIIPVMHHHDFEEHDTRKAIINLNEFERIVAWLSNQPDIDILSLKNLSIFIGHNQIHYGYKNQQLRAKVHWRLQKRLPASCFFYMPTWRYLLKSTLRSL